MQYKESAALATERTAGRINVLDGGNLVLSKVALHGLFSYSPMGGNLISAGIHVRNA
jgi:hypothetical protein